ncbi:MAG TPA: sialidase family protein, partial [Solirubrobacteraceae bacterium]|nr:sialidase family protein [Solirubrobacteraceae bacterium]
MRETSLRSRWWWPMVVGALTLIGCGGQPVDAPRVTSDAGPVHVHGLGVNPADGALFVAAHTGLFRAPRGQLRARRVGDRFQDTMGFAVVGPDRFLGSGHPDLRERLPPFLGLIESRDAGRTWRALSLQGSVDFHVLEARGSRVYGYGSDFESRGERFLASRDGGRTWRRIEPPGPLLSLAIAPGNPDELIAS